ncbi:hypothetical protein QVD17_00409 [Tagetes erecta]|uniref:BTB domain-containing protein n=1 Tax=Tagetes erecta TaxID=13708 RepID=A0AAD8L365_TARER|nr:hypothetical protein QVD17_00409 [Tagetes erecta]
MTTQNDRVRFNVGGKIFETTTTTLAIAGRDSYFGPMFNENWDLLTNPSGEHFIDRNPDCFSIILDLLRTGKLYIPPNVPEKLFYEEAQFYGLMNHVRSAKWGQFDGNRLQSSKSISGRAQGVGKLIRASHDGGCCVAHGRMVHVYDWMFEEHPPINLDDQWVRDACWVGPVDPTGLVISMGNPGEGGLGLFNSTTGELKLKFNVTHADAGPLSISDCCKLFSGCKDRSKENGIGVWDPNTGQQVDFFYEPPGLSFGDANKLQWLKSSGSLFVAGLFPRQHNCYFILLDFRLKSVVRSWSSANYDLGQVQDAIVIEDNNSICVVNELGDLGFMDLRCDSGLGLRCKTCSVRWRGSPLMQEKMPSFCYPKLALHEGQLFLTIDDYVLVFCGSDWVLTSKLRKSFGDPIGDYSIGSQLLSTVKDYVSVFCGSNSVISRFKKSFGGPICDFSIGGDRLFVLHGEENLFDVWETPPSPIVNLYA